MTEAITRHPAATSSYDHDAIVGRVVPQIDEFLVGWLLRGQESEANFGDRLFVAGIAPEERPLLPIEIGKTRNEPDD